MGSVARPPAEPATVGSRLLSVLPLAFGDTERPLRRALALGAHADDIEIGCGGTLLRLLERAPDLEVCWVVFSAAGARVDEARASATDLLAGRVAAGSRRGVP